MIGCFNAFLTLQKYEKLSYEGVLLKYLLVFFLFGGEWINSPCP